VHVRGVRADKCLADLDLAGHEQHLVAHRQPDPVEREPRGGAGGGDGIGSDPVVVKQPLRLLVAMMRRRWPGESLLSGGSQSA
jgi:hypothetical protein